MELKHIAVRGGRLSSFLREEMGMSAALVNRLKWQDKLLVNGTAQHTDYQVQPGDIITALLDAPKPQYPAESGPLTILYEDDHLLAVDKPAGMLIHPSRATLTGTLANRILAHYEKAGQACAFHPITRLDRDTFGIVLVAKNPHIHALFTQQQVENAIEKTYHALVYGCPAEDTGIIDAPIARRELPSLLRYVNLKTGKPSLTHYRVVEKRETCSLLALRPITGRTHQLRVHCAHMGFPILGDPQYGNQESKRFSETLGFTSQKLCAKTLSFPHPITGIPMTLTSKLDV